MFVRSDPIRVAALKDDRFALMHRAVALLRGQIGLRRVGKNGDVAQDLDSRIRGLAGPNPKAILLDPFCPLRLILGTAVEASRCGVEDERGLGCEEREVSLRIVSTKSRDNGWLPRQPPQWTLSFGQNHERETVKRLTMLYNSV